MSGTTLYRVTVEQHEVQVSGVHHYTVPARTMEAGGVTPDDAKRRIIALAHDMAGVPRSRALMDQSMRHAAAVEVPKPLHKQPKEK